MDLSESKITTIEMTYIYYYDVLDRIHSDHMEENRRKIETEREVKYRIVKIGLAELQTRTYCTNLPYHTYFSSIIVMW